MGFKVKYFLVLALIGCAARLPVPAVTDSQHVVKDLVGQRQEKTQWCAAAAARMMMSYKTKELPSQCDIVSRTTGHCDNQPILTEEALRLYGYSVSKRMPSYGYVV